MTVGLEVTECEIVVPGCPARWQRPSSRGRQRYSPTEMREAKEHVRRAWMVAGRPCLPDGPVGVSATFYRDRKPTARPDIDNYLKLILDALNGLAYRDDSQVTDLERVRKRRPSDGAEEHTVIELFAVGEK